MTGRRKDGTGRTTGFRGCFSACFHPSTQNDKTGKAESDAPQGGNGGKGMISKSEKERSLGRVHNSAPEVNLKQDPQDLHKKTPESQVEVQPQNTSEQGEKLDLPNANKESPVSQQPQAAPASTIGKGINTVVKQVAGKEEPAKTYHDLGKRTIQKTADVGAGTTSTIGNATLDVGATTLGLVEGSALSAVEGVQHAAHVANKSIHDPVAKTADSIVGTTALVNETAHNLVAKVADTIVDTSVSTVEGVQHAAHVTNKSIHDPIAITADSLVGTTALVHKSIHDPIAKTADTVLHSAGLVSGATYEVASQGTGLAQHGAHIGNKALHGFISPIADVVAMPFEAVAEVPKVAYETVSYMTGASPNKAENSNNGAHGNGAKGGLGLSVPQDMKDKHHEGRETAKHMTDRMRR